MLTKLSAVDMIAARIPAKTMPGEDLGREVEQELG